MSFGQLITAMVTPFDQNGQINFERTTELIHHLINNGSDAIVIAGTTGESPTLSFHEKVSLFEHAVKISNGRVPIIAGTGSNSTESSIQLTKEAEKVGVNGIMLVAPYYNKPSQEGMFAHFEAIANSTSLPIMLYNIPGRTSVNMTVDLVERLSKIKNIVAMKEASGNLDQMSAIISATPDDFIVYSGDDGLTLPVLSIGGMGVVSVAAHVIGNEMKEMITTFKSGDIARAALLHQKLLPIMKGMFIAPNPAPVKAALEIKGINVGSVRLPLVPLTDDEKNQLKTILN